MIFRESRLSDGQLCGVYISGRATLKTRLYAIGVRRAQEIDEGYLAAGTVVYPARKPSEPAGEVGPVKDAWVYVSVGAGELTQRVLYSALKAAIDETADTTE
jgi:hypothetical protein